MIKERIPISGDLKSKVRQLMEYAGWQEGRNVDISIAEKYYAEHGVPMMKTTQRFYRKYFGLCCEWYLEQKKLNWAADFQFALFPYLVNGIKDHLEEAYFRDMSGCELAEIEQAAGEKCHWQRLNRLPVKNASLSVISATTTRRRSGSPSTGNCMRNMSIRMRSSAFRMCLP